MKNFTQNELRKMYDTPPQELTDQIHQTIASLPYRETEEKIMKKKLSFASVVTIALVLVLMATSLAATNTTVNNWVYKVWPDLAEVLMPVNLSCEDQGIRLEVESAVVQGREILVTYSLEDLEGDRLRDSVYPAHIAPEFSDKQSYTGQGVSGETDPKTKKQYFAGRLEYDDDIMPEDGYFTFTTYCINRGSEETACVDLHPYLTQYGSQIRMTPVPDSLKLAEGAYYGRDLPEDLQVIDSSEGPEIPLCDTVYLSGIGIIDGYLHVQIHYTDYQPLETEVSSGNPYSSWLNALDRDGNPAYYDETDLSILHWGGSEMMPEWTEYILRISPEEAENTDLSLKIEKTIPPIVGNWKIEIPVRMIQRFDQAEADAA